MARVTKRRRCTRAGLDSAVNICMADRAQITQCLSEFPSVSIINFLLLFLFGGWGVWGRSLCVVLVVGLGLGLMRRRRNRVEVKRLCAQSPMVCKYRQRKRESTSIHAV
ncbi:hypothetical protein DFH94DRAFT_786473 [Russula ochroleuca]|uniref:Transmembrane protein n=1 Tax=Russula ochroleuca TaxID=152965 RepID=A0A9P5MKD7_9AGAM|nr:hypothetical protein DFH94DRAFT_786473 [Russula ochroleuca]